MAAVGGYNWRQNLWPVIGDDDGVLELGRKRTVQLVTTVQPSLSISHSASPALIIGSMVKTMPGRRIGPCPAGRDVRHRRRLVQLSPDAVPAPLAHHAIAV